MASSSAKDVEAFLHKVEEIETIVKGLNSGDERKVKVAIQKADEFINAQKHKGETEDEEKDLPKTTTGFSKTVINKSSGNEDSPSNVAYADKQAFMAVMEADAHERSQCRQQREKEAQVIKEIGNLAFKEHNFEKALECYNQAIGKVRNNAVLYTNRAQTRIKLGHFQEALTDCDWAIRASPECIKAYVHMGRAHLALKQYQQARDSYRKVIGIDPKKEGLVQEYLAEVDRIEVADTVEQKARDLFDSGNSEALGISELLVQIRKPEQLPMYYSGGFRVVSSLLSKERSDTKVQFRIQGGLSLIHNHPVLSRCVSCSPQSLSKEEKDMLASAFDLLTQACKGDESNQEQLLQHQGFPEQIQKLLSSCSQWHGTMLKTSIANLLFTISQTAHGRGLLITLFDTDQLFACIFGLLIANSTYSETAASLLCNLSIEKKFRNFLRDKVDPFLPTFEALLRDSNVKSGVISTCITAVINLTNDKTVRHKLSCQRSLWLASEELLVRTSTGSDVELLEAVLGLFVNMTLEPTDTLREFGQRICGHCRSLLPAECVGNAVTERALTILGNILPNSIPAVEWMCDHGGTLLLLRYVKSDKNSDMKNGLKGLTALTQFNEKARKSVVEAEGVTPLTKLLSHQEEGIVGNAALCLSHCVQVPGVAERLSETDIVKELLVLARDCRKPTVQHNCAILIAKLAQGHAKNLERLRELHGIEILHTCMKHVK